MSSDNNHHHLAAGELADVVKRVQRVKRPDGSEFHPWPTPRAIVHALHDAGLLALAAPAETIDGETRAGRRRRVSGVHEPDGSEDAWPDTTSALAESAHGLICMVDGSVQGWEQSDEWVLAADRWCARYDRVVAAPAETEALPTLDEMRADILGLAAPAETEVEGGDHPGAADEFVREHGRTPSPAEAADIWSRWTGWQTLPLGGLLRVSLVVLTDYARGAHPDSPPGDGARWLDEQIAEADRARDVHRYSSDGAFREEVGKGAAFRQVRERLAATPPAQCRGHVYDHPANPPQQCGYPAGHDGECFA